VKLLGIVPSIAYNFILPTWFALVALGAFAVGYGVMESRKWKPEDSSLSTFHFPLITGLAGSLLTVFLGNLGTIQLLFSALQRIAAPGGTVPADVGFFQRWGWALQGVWRVLTEGALLPIGRGDWYWFPSRVIPSGPGNEITEFPLFTFLYSDMHAHMLVMPLALFIIAWALAFVRARAQLTRGEWIASFGIGALFIGALKPTNTWDLYTYYLLAAIAVAYTLFRYFEWNERFNLPNWAGKVFLALGAAGLLYVLGSLFYLPFSQWFGQAYNSVDFWQGSRTPFSSYFTQWGFFLFIITAWLVWETREWMAATPVSHLKRLQPYVLVIEIALAALIALFVFFIVEKAFIGFLALPLAFWAAMLLLRPDQSDEKRFVLFLTGTALTITIAVEFVALVGDIGRMNTIFKLYLQAWMMFAVSAAAAFGWLLPAFTQWRLKWRVIYQTGFYVLLAGVFMFTLTASTDKISDRMNPDAPNTLDAMEFMAHTQHWDGQIMDLSEDYRAIRWMQDNIEGSPVIVEANCTEYRWCTRYTIYTGLPGVVGWNWHQRQQRGIFSIQVQDRVNEVGNFYATTDVNLALNFLKKYDVQYIVVGQLERNVYPALLDAPDGLAKFAEYEGEYWDVVYQELNTTIYQVKP
jgi:YYY domain-containing protein